MWGKTDLGIYGHYRTQNGEDIMIESIDDGKSWDGQFGYQTFCQDKSSPAAAVRCMERMLEYGGKQLRLCKVCGNPAKYQCYGHRMQGVDYPICGSHASIAASPDVDTSFVNCPKCMHQQTFSPAGQEWKNQRDQRERDQGDNWEKDRYRDDRPKQNVFAPPGKDVKARIITMAQIISHDEESVKLVEDEVEKMRQDEVPEVDMQLAVDRKYPGVAPEIEVG